MRLSQCRPGEGGTITHVNGEGALGQRLMELGVIEGAEVRVVRVAPLGDPMEVKVLHYLLTLRKSEAEGVEIAS